MIVRVSSVSKLIYCPATLSGWRIHEQNASFLESEKFVIEKLKWIKNAKLNDLFKDYQYSIDNFEILTKAEGCNLRGIKNKLSLFEVLRFSGNFRSRIKVYISFFPFIYKLFLIAKKVLFYIKWK